jgi:hypothetical protein
MAFEWLKDVSKLAGDVIKAERSSAGRINMLGMVLATVATGLLAIPPVVDGIVHLIRPATPTESPVAIIVVLVVFFLICAFGLAWLDRGRTP